MILLVVELFAFVVELISRVVELWIAVVELSTSMVEFLHRRTIPVSVFCCKSNYPGLRSNYYFESRIILAHRRINRHNSRIPAQADDFSKRIFTKRRITPPEG